MTFCVSRVDLRFDLREIRRVVDITRSNINPNNIRKSAVAKIQVYASDDVADKIMAIVEKRRQEGAKDKDVSFSSVTTMLIELGLRVYEAQMRNKDTGFNQALFNKTLLENVLKSQMATSKLLGMMSLSPHLEGNEKFIFKDMVTTIREDVDQIVSNFFPKDENGEDDV